MQCAIAQIIKHTGLDIQSGYQACILTFHIVYPVPLSPDSSTCNFFLWGYMFFKHHFDIIRKIKEEIVTIQMNISQNTQLKTSEIMTSGEHHLANGVFYRQKQNKALFISCANFFNDLSKLHSSFTKPSRRLSGEINRNIV